MIGFAMAPALLIALAVVSALSATPEQMAAARQWARNVERWIMGAAGLCLGFWVFIMAAPAH